MTRLWPAAAALVLFLRLAIPVPATAAAVPGTTCPMFPTDNVWNADISTLPVNAALTQSVQQLFNSSGSAKLHPDFGPPSYGMPFNAVSSRHQMAWKPPQSPSITFQYARESDNGPYPSGSDIQIEGQYGDGGDDHARSVVVDTCTLSEVWHAQLQSQPYTGGSGAVWNLRSDALRPDGWTSADAAGLPILPGLVRYDEVQAGSIRHALRFTLSQTAMAHIWPARHDAGTSGAGLPPMGTRLRLKASFDTTGYHRRRAGRAASDAALRDVPRRQRQRLVLPGHS